MYVFLPERQGEPPKAMAPLVPILPIESHPNILELQGAARNSNQAGRSLSSKDVRYAGALESASKPLKLSGCWWGGWMDDLPHWCHCSALSTRARLAMCLPPRESQLPDVAMIRVGLFLHLCCTHGCNEKKKKEIELSLSDHTFTKCLRHNKHNV